MNKNWSKFKIALNLLMVLVASVVIVYFMPHTQTFSYDYAVDQPWKYSKITADFSFSIYKSEKQLQEERDSVLRSLTPFFIEDKNKGSQQVSGFQSDLSGNDAVELTHAEKVALARMLREVYESGITDETSYALVVDSVRNVKIVDGTSSRTLSVKSLQSPRSAYEHIALRADSIGITNEKVSASRINNFIVPNLVYDAKHSDEKRREGLSSIINNTGKVQQGEKIIDRGEIVTEKIYRELESLKREIENKKTSWEETLSRVVGQFLCVVVLLGVFVTYLYLYRRDYLEKMRYKTYMIVMTLIFTVAPSFAQQDNELNIYVVPFAIVPIFTRVFLDSRTAFTLMLVVVSICSLTLHNPYEFMLLQIVSGLTAIYTLRELTSRSQLMRTVVLVVIITALVKFGYDLSQGLFASLDTSWYIRIGINGVFLLFAYPAMLLFEKLFGFVSSVTLVELSSVNNTLLRRLSKEAQGTFNHSMQVANIGTEVASKLDADVQLVRTAALYHDIGKLSNPAFFTENQFGSNPHDKLQEKQSAQIIIHHVSDGLELADKHRLPQAIKECIATHHGRSKTKFFYVNFVNKHPGEPVNEELFSYPSPNPCTKEQAIIMMADSVEAASRSLKEVSEDNLRTLVEKIIDQQIADGYFKECPISYREIAIAKDVFVNSLKTIYHTRVSYPEIARPAEETATSAEGEVRPVDDKPKAVAQPDEAAEQKPAAEAEQPSVAEEKPTSAPETQAPVVSQTVEAPAKPVSLFDRPVSGSEMSLFDSETVAPDHSETDKPAGDA